MTTLNGEQRRIYNSIERYRQIGSIDGGTAEEMRKRIREGDTNDAREVQEQLWMYDEVAADFMLGRGDFA